MKYPSYASLKKTIKRSLASIRTRVGIGTGILLLAILLAFYIGGRLVLVKMIRTAEKEVESIGFDVQHIVYDNLDRLQLSVAEIIRTASAPDGTFSDTALRQLLSPHRETTPINVAILLDTHGKFITGWYAWGTDLPPVRITKEVFAPYIAIIPTWIQQNKTSTRQHTAGLLRLDNRSITIAIDFVPGKNKHPGSYLLLGSLFQQTEFLAQVNTRLDGLQVRMTQPDASIPRARHNQTKKQNNTFSQPNERIPMFDVAMDFYSGGMWYLNKDRFEAIIPIIDICGKEVTSISIALPQSFSSVANIALGWLTFFVAAIGMIAVIPIFWLQAHVLLNPLSKISSAIRLIGDTHEHGDCARLTWPKHDEFGELANSVNALLDTIARKSLRVAQTELSQRAMLAAIPDTMCIFDAQARLVTQQKQQDDVPPVPGITQNQRLSTTVYAESDTFRFQASIHRVFATGRMEMLTLQTRDGLPNLRYFEIRISRMDEHFVLVLFRDMTAEHTERNARMKVESRLSKIQHLESLGILSAGIAHDVNNVLTIILSTVESAWEAGATRPREESLATIRQAITKGAAMARELMSYAGETHINFRRTNPSEFIRDLEKLLQGAIHRSATLQFQLPADLPAVDIDPQQFWKVFVNLARNASEAMSDRVGEIRIATYSMALTEKNSADFFSTTSLRHGPGVVFEVSDNGNGMSPETMQRIFEPFYSTKSVGRGLGLATVFALVDAHGGGIALDSEPGIGTMFRIWLPVSHASTPTPVTDNATPMAIQPSETPRPKRPPCVLLIDNDLAILATTSIIMKSMQVTLLTAPTHKEAVSLFRKSCNDIDFILLDAHLGELTTVRLLGILRMTKADVPIILMSGSSENILKPMFASQPYDAYLGKPYTLDELKALIQRYGPKN